MRPDLNLSGASTSLIFTISLAQSSLAAPLYGWLVDRFGPRPLIALGAIVASVGVVVITFVNNYILFLIAYVTLVSIPTNFEFGPTLMTLANTREMAAAWGARSRTKPECTFNSDQCNPPNRAMWAKGTYRAQY